MTEKLGIHWLTFISIETVSVEFDWISFNFVVNFNLKAETIIY